MLVRLMLMLDDLQEAKTMQRSNFDNYKEIREGLTTNDHDNGIYCKDTAKKKAKDLFEEYKKTLKSNSMRCMETNLLPLAIGGAGPNSMIFAQWFCDKYTIDLGEGMRYHEERHKCNIDLLRFCELFDALPEVIKEEFWNFHVLDKHLETIEEKIAEGIDIWNDPDQDVSTILHNVKLYMVIIKHHDHYTKAKVRDIDLFYAGGRSKGDSS